MEQQQQILEDPFFTTSISLSLFLSWFSANFCCCFSFMFACNFDIIIANIYAIVLTVEKLCKLTHTHGQRETKLHTQTGTETETGSSQGAPTGGDKKKTEKTSSIALSFLRKLSSLSPTQTHIYTHSPNCEADSATLQKGVG